MARSRAQRKIGPKHFRESVVPELRIVPGFLGAHLSQRQMGDRVEFVVLTHWQSMDAIRSFAGASVDKAVVEPGAVAALIDFFGRSAGEPDFSVNSSVWAKESLA